MVTTRVGRADGHNRLGHPARPWAEVAQTEMAMGRKSGVVLLILFPFSFHLFKSQKLVQISKIHRKIIKMQIKFCVNLFEHISSVI
jgi:hypothetical protein